MDGRTIAGREVPVIGQGTWYMELDADPIGALRRGLDLGLTHVDTAEMYGSGQVESIVGEAIAGRRDEVFLVSKVLPGNASRRGTIEACEASLARLGTDWIDLYLLHWPGRHPLAETVEAFEHLVAAGKIRAYGVSNFDVPDLDALARACDVERIACNQVLYHPLERAVEDRVGPWCARHGVPVVAYSPLGHGGFPGTGAPEREAIDRIARRRRVSPHQVALRFVVRDRTTLAIPKASTISHVEDNAAAAHWSLDDDEITALENALPAPRHGAHLPML